MTVRVKLKALAKRKPVIESHALTIPDGIQLVNELISAIVRRNVQAFNEKETDKPLFMYLSKDTIEDMAETGKIGFGDKKKEQTQDAEEAVRNALESFADGLFRVFINEAEVAFGQEITLAEGDELLFIKVAMLAGRLW